MPGLVPGIDVLAAKRDVDGRDKPGHDAHPSRYAFRTIAGFKSLIVVASTCCIMA